MSATAVGVRPRASLALRLIYGQCVSVALSPAACCGLRGWFAGARLVRTDRALVVASSPWPVIFGRLALLLAVLAVAVACGYWRGALIAVAGYALGMLDARFGR